MSDEHTPSPDALTFQAEVEIEAVREHGCRHRTGGDVCADCFETMCQLAWRPRRSDSRPACEHDIPFTDDCSLCPRFNRSRPAPDVDKLAANAILALSRHSVLARGRAQAAQDILADEIRRHLTEGGQG